MHIQLNLDEIFETESPAPKMKSKPVTPELSIISEYHDQTFEPMPKTQPFELDSSELFRGSSTGSGQLQTDTFTSTQALPSHYSQPGERLYYEHRHNLVRKLKDMERWKYEVTQKEKDVLTFSPQLDKNSLKIINSKEYNPENLSKAHQRKLARLKEYEDARAFEAIKQCTFKPQIDNKKTAELSKSRSSSDVFYNLYQESKMKEIRLKVKQQVTEPTPVPGGQKAVENFLKRNSQFHERTLKKMSLLEEKSQQYDLSTGQKLFSPRVTKFNPSENSYSKTGAIFHKDSLYHLNDRLREKFEESMKGSVGEKLPKESPNIEACFQQ